MNHISRLECYKTGNYEKQNIRHLLLKQHLYQHPMQEAVQQDIIKNYRKKGE